MHPCLQSLFAPSHRFVSEGREFKRDRQVAVNRRGRRRGWETKERTIKRGNLVEKEIKRKLKEKQKSPEKSVHPPQKREENEVGLEIWRKLEQNSKEEEEETRTERKREEGEEEDSEEEKNSEEE
jgi:hypothetical protein